MQPLDQILAHLPENKIKELETLTQRIVATGQVEFVVLFGSYARGNYKEKRGKERGKKSDYDILVVTADADTRKGLRKKLRGIFKGIGVPVQLIVERIGLVNNALEEKQYFFTDIKREGKVLYNSGRFELSEPKALSPTRRREIAEEDFKEWFGTAKEIFKHIRTPNPRLAAFDLQQVVEFCYTTIDMVYTHYNPHEHNLEPLRGRAKRLDSRAVEAFPCKTREQKELFDYLNLAYIGGRYRSEEEYPVTKTQLDYWRQEAQKLLDLTEVICKERIEELREIEGMS